MLTSNIPARDHRLFHTPCLATGYMALAASRSPMNRSKRIFAGVLVRISALILFVGQYFNFGALTVTFDINPRKKQKLLFIAKTLASQNRFLNCRSQSNVLCFSRGRDYYRLFSSLLRNSSLGNQKHKSTFGFPFNLASTQSELQNPNIQSLLPFDC